MEQLHAIIVYGILTACLVRSESDPGNLRCYSCAMTGGKNYCEEYETYEDATNTNDTSILKECTAPYNKSCIIETFSINGASVSHIRDCSDNERFSFTSNLQNNRSAYVRLYELELNNETACVWDGQHQVCLSKCNTDFCNGPQFNLTEINNGQITCFSGIALAITLIITLYNLAQNCFYCRFL